MTTHSFCPVQLSSILDKSAQQIEAIYRVSKDVFYGTEQGQNMDIYTSKEAVKLGDKNFTIVFLHGGAFYWSDKSLEEKYIQPYLNKGMQVVNVNYRLKQGVPAATEDLTLALQFLAANRATYPLPLNNIILAGFSAGAHIASLVGLAANNPEYPQTLSKEIKIAGIINFSGLVDRLDLVEKVFMDHEDPMMQTIGKALFPFIEGYTPESISAKYEPITYFDKNDPPYFLWYGGQDDQIPPATFNEFVNVLNKDKNKNVVIFSPESTHFPRTTERKIIYDRLFTFLDNL